MGTVSYAKEIEIRREVDVFVGGGGPAGAIAAVAAAREGSSVFLAEGACCFGGMGTIGMVPVFMQASDGVNLLCAGLGKEIMDRAYDCGDGSHSYMAIDKEALKRAYDEMVTDAGVGYRFMTQIIDVKTNGPNVEYVVLSGKSGIYAVKAKIYVDCTGDGDICAFAGARYDKGDESGVIMPSTLCSLWNGINWTETGESRQDSFIELAFEDGVLPVCDRHLPGVFKVGLSTGGGNTGHAYGADGTDESTVTKAMVEQRRLLVAYEKYYKKYVKGFENAKIVSTAELLGTRASRRITGDYVLNLNDFKKRADFDDEIGRYCYPVDIHPAVADKEAYERFEKEFYEEHRYAPGESYGIPYRILTPKGLDNVLVAGRCVSTDNYMQASIRVMPGCYITGQAAGTAAAIAASTVSDIRGVCVRRLQERLRANGAYLRS